MLKSLALVVMLKKYHYNNVLDLTTKLMWCAMAAHILMGIFRVNTTKGLPNALYYDHQEDLQAQFSDVYDQQKQFPVNTMYASGGLNNLSPTLAFGKLGALVI